MHRGRREVSRTIQFNAAEPYDLTSLIGVRLDVRELTPGTTFVEIFHHIAGEAAQALRVDTGDKKAQALRLYLAVSESCGEHDRQRVMESLEDDGRLDAPVLKCPPDVSVL